MPKQSPPDSGEAPALRRSARIKNVKTPPVYNVSGASGESKKRKSAPRKPRASGTESSERRKPAKRRSNAGGDSGKRSTAKRKKTSGPAAAETTETEVAEAHVEDVPMEESAEAKGPPTEDKPEPASAHLQEEEAPESSVSMVVNVPSVLESASLLDDSESELKASMASLLDQTAARASACFVTSDGSNLCRDAPVASSETQAESDQLSQNGIFANVSVTAAEERVFGKTEDEEAADFPLRQELKGLRSGAFVFSRRAAHLSRSEVTVLFTMDYEAEGSPDVEETVITAERVSADLFLAQNLPSDLIERLKATYASIGDKPEGYPLQAFIRNESDTSLVKVCQYNDILKESAISKLGEAFDRTLHEHSKLSVLAFSVKQQGSADEVTVVNVRVSADMLDVACIELAAVVRYMRKRCRDFILVGNWNAFPPSQEDFGSVLQVLLGEAEKSTLIASIPNPCMVHDGSEEHPLISGYEDIFDDIPRNMLLNFDGEDRPASNVWATGSVKIVAAWQRVNRDRGPSLVAFTTANDETLEQ